METFSPKYFGRLSFNEEANHEYFELFQQSKEDSGMVLCIMHDSAPIGQHFLDFLLANEDSLSSVLKQCHELFNLMTANYHDDTMVADVCRRLLLAYQRISEIYPFWKPVLYGSQVLKAYDWYNFYLTRAYIAETGSNTTEEERLDRMKFYWDTICDRITYELKYLDNYLTIFTSFRNAISFCLDANEPAELIELNNKQRAYIYQHYFDNSFINNRPIAVVLNMSESEAEGIAKMMPQSSFTKTAESSTINLTANNLNYYEIVQTHNTPIRLSQLAEKGKSKDVAITSSLLLREIEDIYTLCLYSFMWLVKNNIKVRHCRNCGNYFVPFSRNDEIYCRRMQLNGRMCNSLDYDVKINSDEYLKCYRTAYKTRNARKRRNMKNRPKAEDEFRAWTMYAKAILAKAQNGEISLGDFKAALNKDLPIDGDRC